MGPGYDDPANSERRGYPTGMKLSRFLECARKRFSVPPADPSASKKAGMERRQSARAELDYPVELLDAARRPADGAVHLLDLSGVGLGISTSKDFRIGDALGVSIKTGERVVNATARIRWARPEGMLTAYGLELEGLGYWDRRRVSSLCARGGLGADEALNLLLQFGAAALSVCVAADWLASEPDRLTALAFSLPLIIPVIGGLFLLWAISRL